MSMPIDVETLLNRQRIESERIEFKRGKNRIQKCPAQWRGTLALVFIKSLS